MNTTLVKCLFFLLFITGSITTNYSQLPGLRTVGRFLEAPTGERIILRGVNDETVWLNKSGIPTFAEIAKTNSNVIRIVWDKSGTAAELDIAIQNCVKAGMIPMPELHDATGNWSALGSLVDRWTSSEFAKVLIKHEQYLVLNIGNEVGQDVSDSDFRSGYNLAVQRLRRAGIRCPLLIDASGYGQSYDAIKNNAKNIMSSDSLGNVMFSVHMYWPLKWNGNSKAKVEEKIRNTLDDAVSQGIPLIVGEFGEAFTENGTVNPEDSIPFRTIMAECNKREIGWIPWSWRGNKPQTDLDMTSDGTYAGLKLWGLEAMVTDPNSIQNISKPSTYITQNVASGNFPSTGAAKPIVILQADNDGVFHFHLEEGLLSGKASIGTDISGFQGSGYIANIQGEGDDVSLSFQVNQADSFELKIRYHIVSENGDKGLNYSVGQMNQSFNLPNTNNQWEEVSTARIFLDKGTHTIKVGGGWGWYELDEASLSPIETSTSILKSESVFSNTDLNTKSFDLRGRSIHNPGKQQLHIINLNTLTK